MQMKSEKTMKGTGTYGALGVDPEKLHKKLHDVMGSLGTSFTDADLIITIEDLCTSMTAHERLILAYVCGKYIALNC